MTGACATIGLLEQRVAKLLGMVRGQHQIRNRAGVHCVTAERCIEIFQCTYGYARLTGSLGNRHGMGNAHLHEMLLVRNVRQTDMESIRFAHYASHGQQSSQMLARNTFYRQMRYHRLSRRCAELCYQLGDVEFAGVIRVIDHPPVVKLVVVLLEHFHYGIGRSIYVKPGVEAAIDSQPHSAGG